MSLERVDGVRDCISEEWGPVKLMQYLQSMIILHLVLSVVTIITPWLAQQNNKMGTFTISTKVMKLPLQERLNFGNGSCVG